MTLWLQRDLLMPKEGVCIDSGKMYLEVDYTRDSSFCCQHHWYLECCQDYTTLQLEAMHLGSRKRWKRFRYISIGQARKKMWKSGDLCCSTVHKYPEVVHQNYTGHGRVHSKWCRYRTSHLLHCVLCESKEVIGCWVSNENTREQPKEPEATPNGIMATPHPSITRDKWEDIVLYLPREQENPPPATLVVDDRLEGDGH